MRNIKYYSDGSIGMGEFLKTTPIITRPSETEIKTLIISDLHIGCSIERLDLLDKVFEYAVRKNIHIILGCGDLLDGNKHRSAAQSTTRNLDEQIELFVERYPYDNSILTFSVLGDHEQYAAKTNVDAVARKINELRKDVIISESERFLISIKNEIIKLKHKMELCSQEKINIFGHTHDYIKSVHTNFKSAKSIDGHKVFDKGMLITAPSLSDANQGVPSMLEMNMHFDNGYIDEVITKEIGFVDNEEVILSDSIDKFAIFECDDEIKYEEEYEKVKVKM